MSFFPFRIIPSTNKTSISRFGRSIVNMNSRFLRIIIRGGNNQSTPTSTTLPLPLVVEVQDKNNNPFNGAKVTWSTYDYGEPFFFDTYTDVYGTSSIGYDVGNSLGTGSVTASVGTDVKYLYYYKTTASAITMEAITQLDQTALINTTASSLPTVFVSDAGGIPYPNYPVTFSIGVGGGHVSGGMTLTDFSGYASPYSWSVGPSIGQNTLICSASTNISGSPIVFRCTGITPSPNTITIISGNNQTNIIAGQTAPIPLKVQIQDSFTSPLPNQLVYFTILTDAFYANSTASTLLPTTMSTDNSGMASASLATSTVVGTIHCSAYFFNTSGSSQEVYFTASTVPGPPNKLIINTQPAAFASSDIILTTQPIIHIVDLNNNIITNASGSVTASIASGNATITAQAAVPFISGVSTYSSLTLQDLDLGDNILAFSSSNVTAITSSIISFSGSIPYQIQFNSSLSDGTTSAALTTFYINILDSNGLLVPGSTNIVTLSISSSISNVLGGTTSSVASNGTASFNNVLINQTGSYKLYAASTGLVPSTSSIFSITQQTTNVPVGATLVGRINFGTQALPTSYVSAPQTTYGLVVGKARKDTGASVITDSNIPDGDQYAYRFTFPVGKTTGTGPGGTWYLHEDLAGNTDGNAVHSYDEMYFSTRFRAFGYDAATNSIPQNNWELVTSIGEFKALGQWGYARNGNSQPNDAILFLRDPIRSNAPWGPGVLTTQFAINIQTQGAVDQTGLPGGSGVNRNFYPNKNGYGANTAIYSCGTSWSNLVELYAKMNTIGSDDGIYRIWYGGILILEYTNCRFRDASNPRGFRARHWNPVLGGGGPGAKTRRDVLDIAHLDLYFKTQID